MMINSAGLSDIGRKRRENQDCFCTEDRFQLYIVADGMGGHLAGEVAAQMVVDSVRGYFIALDGNRQSPPQTRYDDALSRDANHLLNAIAHANDRVYRASLEQPAHRGMGSTVAALLFTADTFIAANVGDSSIFFIHANRIKRISTPHTVAAEQRGAESELRMLYGPDFQHMLTRSMGITAEVEPDFCESQFSDGDRFVICSDGLSDKVSPAEILEMASSGTPSEICRRLVDLANERGGDDNTTVVVLAVGMKPRLWPRLKLKFYNLLPK